MYTEKQLKNALKLLEKNWNNKYWLFVTGGSINLMEKENNQHGMLLSGGVNPLYIVEDYSIDADGGDW
jgi:hypothetical protein